MTVICSVPQKGILESAAKAARSDASIWILAHALRGAGAADKEGSPVIITGPVADKLRALGDRQGISPDRALEQLLIAEG